MVSDGRHVGDVGGDGLDLPHELVPDASVVLKPSERRNSLGSLHLISQLDGNFEHLEDLFSSVCGLQTASEVLTSLTVSMS